MMDNKGHLRASLAYLRVSNGDLSVSQGDEWGNMLTIRFLPNLQDFAATQKSKRRGRLSAINLISNLLESKDNLASSACWLVTRQLVKWCSSEFRK